VIFILFFAGAKHPIQVKLADAELEKLENKIFIGMLPRKYTEEVNEMGSWRFAKKINLKSKKKKKEKRKKRKK
jgi:hypothetical protein